MTGELDVDLRSNIAAEARAKIVYERLIKFLRRLRDEGSPSIGSIRPTPGMVEQYYNDSTGTGDHGAIDADGPWKMADGIMVVKSPALKGFKY